MADRYNQHAMLIDKEGRLTKYGTLTSTKLCVSTSTYVRTVNPEYADLWRKEALCEPQYVAFDNILGVYRPVCFDIRYPWNKTQIVLGLLLCNVPHSILPEQAIQDVQFILQFSNPRLFACNLTLPLGHGIKPYTGELNRIVERYFELKHYLKGVPSSTKSGAMKIRSFFESDDEMQAYYFGKLYFILLHLNRKFNLRLVHPRYTEYAI